MEHIKRYKAMKQKENEVETFIKRIFIAWLIFAGGMFVGHYLI